MNTTFAPGAMIRFGWDTFKTRPWFFIGSYVLAGLIFAVADGIAGSFAPQTGPEASLSESLTMFGIVSFMLSFVINMLYSMGTTSYSLKTEASPAAVTYTDLWRPRPFWNFVGTGILAGIIMVAGLIFFIVPGIILAIMFSFATYFVLDKGLSPLEALKESRRITAGHKWQLFVLGLAILGINILGLLALVVGLLVSMPVSMFAMAHAYRTLSQSAAPTV